MDASFSPKGRTSERVEMELSAGHQDCRSLAAAVDANVDRLVGPIEFESVQRHLQHLSMEAQVGASSSREATRFNSPRRNHLSGERGGGDQRDHLNRAILVTLTVRSPALNMSRER